MDKEKQILSLIKANPFITQNELSAQLGLSRSAVAGYISALVRKGSIIGRAYVLPKEASIVCIGGANVDRKAHCLGPFRLRESNPAAIAHSCGGVARNIAENLGRLGSAVSLITLVGNDNEGKWLLAETKTYGVDVSQAIELPNARTGTYTAILDDRNDMIAAVADMQIYDSFSTDMLQSKWPHIAAGERIVADTNLPAELIRYLVERCRDDSRSLCINTVSAAKTTRLPEDLRGVDMIFCNRHEAGALAGIPVEDQDGCKDAWKRISARGVRKIVITLGEQGLFWAEADNDADTEADPASEAGRYGYVRPHKVNVVDVTGAGDALMAGVIFGLAQGEPFATACRLGTAAAALTVQTNRTVADLNAELLYETMAQHQTEGL
ncbi:hypothetical protein SD70_08410 [Gordoniibacillus kamchatkensis]|uniref:Carbohydrate kinase PfkB domain-containing protein n=1 Tax=Gordoniibacillus kamchatkensis TaxID=1590651 RepID=A0ABR5AJP5_9BACL|nr:carbohydrate kinase [Paenibacillus sp. VKM B-2647]KIL41261.1 hypothetical protein SD70_08410 [Paenibacillus sp. VKM B-2647]